MTAWMSDTRTWKQSRRANKHIAPGSRRKGDRDLKGAATDFVSRPTLSNIGKRDCSEALSIGSNGALSEQRGLFLRSLPVLHNLPILVKLHRGNAPHRPPLELAFLVDSKLAEGDLGPTAAAVVFVEFVVEYRRPRTLGVGVVECESCLGVGYLGFLIISESDGEGIFGSWW